MAITKRQSKATTNTDVDTDITVTLDAAPVEGNLLVASYAIRGTGNTSASLSGWTSGPMFASPAFDGGVAFLWYKVAGAGESATVTVAKNASSYASLCVTEFSGVDAFDTSGSADAVTASTSLSAGPLSATSGSLLVIAAFVQASRAALPITFGSGYTSLQTAQVNASGPASAVGYRIISGASSTQTATATSSESDGYGWGMLSFSGLSMPAGAYADWDGDGFSPDDDLGPYLRSWRITRGASAEITGGAQPGEAVIVLNNPADDRFNPYNSSGPLYGKLRDGVPIWVGVNNDGALSGATPRGLFAGRILDITPVPSAGGGRALTVEIRCEDALGWLRRTPVQVSDAMFRTQAAFRAAVLAAAGETRTDLDDEIHTMPLSSWDGDALGALEALNRANGTRHFIRPADNADLWYDYVTRNRQWRLDGTVDASFDAGVDYVTGSGGWRLSADTVTNQQRATVTPIRFTPGAVTVWEADVLPFNVVSGTPREVWVEFDDYVASPVVDYAYTGTSPTVTLDAYGSTAKLTLTSSGTTTVTALSIEGSLARRGNAESVEENDTTSQALPRGVRAGSEISGDLVGILPTAQGIASHVVWRYGNIQSRPTVTVANWIPEMFEVDLYDVVAGTIDQLATSAVHYEVVGLALECDFAASASAKLHTATYVLQECRVQSDPGWFTWDVSDWDGTDVLAY